MKARLYGIAISHPSRAARLMLDHKGIEYHLVNMPVGMQAVRIPLAGFRGGTVPALRIDGRRLVGTRAISRALDEIQPDPPLFPREDAASVERIREDWAATPGHLDRVDALIADGTLDGEALNAADFQIVTTLRVMLASDDYGPLIEGRPAAALAQRVWPDHRYRLPSLLPASATT